MSANPYHLEGPALVSFSGGRTSGYLLAQILQAHGGILPPDVRVASANTGREHSGTLRFVHEVATRWRVKIHWVEWRATPPQVENCFGFRGWLTANDPHGLMIDPAEFAEVGPNSACGDGEPFAAVIAMKRAIPNGRARWRRLWLDPGAGHTAAISSRSAYAPTRSRAASPKR